jgi:hypothetical protein
MILLPACLVLVLSHLAAWKYQKDRIVLLGRILMGITSLGCIVAYHGQSNEFLAALEALIQDNRSMLILLGLLFMIWPSSALVKMSLSGIVRSGEIEGRETAESGESFLRDAERGGRMIGIFERLIIFILVLLGEYAAIGFLITGKSIIRFAQRHENIRSEYVLVGTMVSYGLAILVGVLVNYMLAGHWIAMHH